MKKIFTMLLAMALLLTFVACGKKSDNYLESYDDDVQNFNGDTYAYDDYYENNILPSNNNEKNNATHYNDNTNKNNVSNKVTQSTQKPVIIYEKINYDKSGYKNKASIEKIDINDSKMYITFKILEHYGGGYNSFATNAIFYDFNNNIIDIKQVMYARNIDTAINSTFVDDTYIPDGTKTILINSGTKNVKYKTSNNHGNSSINFDIPRICYDKNGYGNSVEVKSYNVYNGKIFLTYSVNGYYGGGYNAHATDMIFYNNQGSVLDKKQTLYVSNLDNDSIGCVCFDYTHIPAGTTKIVINANKPSSNSNQSSQNNSSASSSQSSSSNNQNQNNETKSWSSSDAKRLDNYIKYSDDYLTKAKNYCSKGITYYVIANNYIKMAADQTQKAIDLFDKNGDVKTTDGTSLFEMIKELYDKLTELKGITIDYSNVEEYKDKIRNISYNCAVDTAKIRILTIKFKAEF